MIKSLLKSIADSMQVTVVVRSDVVFRMSGERLQRHSGSLRGHCDPKAMLTSDTR